jgi:hypothetical protein
VYDLILNSRKIMLSGKKNSPGQMVSILRHVLSKGLFVSGGCLSMKIMYIRIYSGFCNRGRILFKFGIQVSILSRMKTEQISIWSELCKQN